LAAGRFLRLEHKRVEGPLSALARVHHLDHPLLGSIEEHKERLAGLPFEKRFDQLARLPRPHFCVRCVGLLRTDQIPPNLHEATPSAATHIV
jgi:hypothetical protein